ncbi:MAG: Ppx/GppA phosphatase, partial [Azorhizobium sp. 35-67-5]
MRDETHRPSLGAEQSCQDRAGPGRTSPDRGGFDRTGNECPGSGTAVAVAPGSDCAPPACAGQGEDRTPSSCEPQDAHVQDVRTHGGLAPAPAHDGLYAALDLGTNNCRLLVARPTARNFRVVDAFSRIVRLGEGLTASGRLSAAAMGRAVGALEVCAGKISARGVTRMRVIATEACRAADNGDEFCSTVAERTGLVLEVVDRRTEAGLAAAGCAPLVDPTCEGAILFDIGGGSTEVVWLGRRAAGDDGPPRARIRSWASLPVGVVSLAERHGGVKVSRDLFE